MSRPCSDPGFCAQVRKHDLKAWNRSWDDSDGFWESAEARRAWEQQGRELAIGVQKELGTDGWEVLYQLGGQAHKIELRKKPVSPNGCVTPSRSPAQTAQRQPSFDRQLARLDGPSWQTSRSHGRRLPVCLVGAPGAAGCECRMISVPWCHDCVSAE